MSGYENFRNICYQFSMRELFFFINFKLGDSMKRLIGLVLAVAFLTVGCTGSFVLTKNVYDFHRNQDGKWMDELMFLGAVILPVYGLATAADAIVFNTIEFWTEENPLLAKAVGKTRIVNSAVKMTQESSNKVRIDSLEEAAALIIERSDDGVIAKDDRGNILYISKTNTDGGISVYNSDEKLIRKFSQRQVLAARNMAQ